MQLSIFEYQFYYVSHKTFNVGKYTDYIQKKELLIMVSGALVYKHFLQFQP